MTVWVALLRAINVSGSGRLPMKEFRALLSGMGFEQVETYIQSGNAVFGSGLAAPALERMIRDGVLASFGFAPDVFLVDAERIAAALMDHPFAGAEPSRVHVCFLKTTPAPDEAVLEALAVPGDGWHIGPCRFTLHTPAGYGSSKLAQTLPRLLPAPMTARNLRSVAALHALAAARG
ncbi:MAG TPA: DUF1697 domain-containing protein [Tabrizicola sp.]|nr:DUF1697 domain-containing protein [Tabrizicola sp.]